MRDLLPLTTDELYIIAADLKAMVTGWENRGARRSAKQDEMLRDARAEHRRVKREIKRRHVQLRMF